MEFMEFIWAYILVFLLAALPFVEAIFLTPIAVVAGLSIVPTFILAVLGNLLTVYFVIVFINKIKQWRKKKNEEAGKSGKRTARAEQLWKKYGLPGLTLIGPFLIGSHLSAFLSLVFGGTKKQVTIWITISVVGWSLLLGILAALGFEFMNVENPFIEQFFEEQ
ncbi:small multi-drug export protein [Gracilibacillus sp. HCP3S3_G5_1]|uniref:small multi-drug export protein n=1 Tax=unclassified Gracilibacillus TaxID=2625209 RepID=UPI003F8AAE70